MNQNVKNLDQDNSPLKVDTELAAGSHAFSDDYDDDDDDDDDDAGSHAFPDGENYDDNNYDDDDDRVPRFN